MTKIPFDIKFKPQIESGEYKVETRDGRPVRIVCYNREYGCPVMALATEADGHESYVSCNFDGRVSRINEYSSDLFIITTESKLTSWQTFISGCLQKYGLLDCGAADRIAKECSAELLELAKDELTKQGNLILPIEAFEKRYVEAQEKGRKEALKDLPRWRKLNNIHEGLPYRSLVLYGMDDRKWEIADKGKQIGVLAMYIPIGDLKELPKDYSGELPGFNE